MFFEKKNIFVNSFDEILKLYIKLDIVWNQQKIRKTPKHIFGPKATNMKNILEVFFTKMLRIMPEIISKGEKSRLKYLKMYLQTNYIPETNISNQIINVVKAYVILLQFEARSTLKVRRA